MQKYKSNLTSVSGAAVRGASITVLDETGAIASIFLDRAGNIPAGNPLKTGQDGTFEFYAVNGRYSLRTDSSGLNVLEEDVILMFDPENAAEEGPIADAIEESQEFVQSGSLSVTRTVQDKAREAVSSSDKGVTGDGTDETAKLTATIATGAAARFLPSTVRVVDQVRAGGKRLQFEPGFRAYASPTDPAMAHAQVIPSAILPDSYTRFDFSRFGRTDPVVMAYGDSNTAWVDPSGRIGVGQGSWPAYLEAFLGEYVYFAGSRVRGDGSPGQTSQYALDNFDLFMATYSPQITVLGWGTNDLAQGVITREQYVANMALLIEKFQQAGVFVVVLGIPWHNVYAEKVRAWNSSLAELCRNYSVEFIPVYTLFSSATSTYFASDGIHYTHVANQILAKVLGERIIRNYSLPKNRMQPYPVRQGSTADFYSWECEGVRSTVGKRISVVQTPDQYVRRLFPFSLKIDAGMEVTVAAAGPFAALFSYPDSIGASWTLNGNPYSPTTRGSVIKLISTAPRLDGSSSQFRVGSSSGSIYMLATFAEFGFPPRVYTPAEIRVGIYVPNRRITVQDATHHLDTVMIEISGSGDDIGYSPDLHIPNVGPLATRTAITAAPVGFKFYQSDATQSWWRWDGSAWQSY